MKLYLVCINPVLVEEWKRNFSMFEDVSVEYGDILNIAESTIISPANGYGFMDGGIDRLYTEFF